MIGCASPEVVKISEILLKLLHGNDLSPVARNERKEQPRVMPTVATAFVRPTVNQLQGCVQILSRIDAPSGEISRRLKKFRFPIFICLTEIKH